MKQVLVDEISNERPNSSALGSFNSAVATLAANKNFGVRSLDVQRKVNAYREADTIIRAHQGKLIKKKDRMTEGQLKAVERQRNAMKAAFNKYQISL